MAECVYKGRRLVVRRTRLTDAHQAKLWPDWRHFGFLTDLGGDTVAVDAFHRQHAVVELAIRDLKEGAGWNTSRLASSAPTAPGCNAPSWPTTNLIRWTVTLGTDRPVDQGAVARTIRTRLLAIPGRLVNLAGTITLRGPKNWPWAQWFTLRLDRLRTLQPTTG